MCLRTKMTVGGHGLFAEADDGRRDKEKKGFRSKSKRITLVSAKVSGQKEGTTEEGPGLLTGSDRRRTPPGCAVSPAVPFRCSASSPNAGSARRPPT